MQNKIYNLAARIINPYVNIYVERAKDALIRGATNLTK